MVLETDSKLSSHSLSILIQIQTEVNIYKYNRNSITIKSRDPKKENGILLLVVV